LADVLKVFILAKDSMVLCDWQAIEMPMKFFGMISVSSSMCHFTLEVKKLIASDQMKMM
jgi:hypothetical protein